MPCPMRFGPPPSTMIFFRRSVAPRTRTFGLVGRVHVGGVGGKLGRAGIDPLVDRAHTQRAALAARIAVLGGLEQLAPAGGPRSPSA